MNIAQRSMAGGELSPSLYPRTDAAKYSFGLRTMRNFWVRRDGGSDNRPGTKFVNRNRTHSSYSRLIPFSISGTEGYAVHFEEGHFRVLYRGKPLTVAVNANANNIIGISVAAQVVVSVANTNGVWENGVECYIEGVHGMPEINGKIYLVSDVDDATDTFKLKDLDGNYVNSSTYGAWISGGTVKHVAHGTHDYLSAELATIQFVQRKKHLESYVDTTTLGSIASLIMTHPNHPVQELQVGSYYESTGLGFAYSPSDYELTYNLVQNVISASLNAPTGGSYTYRYCLTAILENGEETTPIIVSSGAGSNWAISGISKANPAVVTVSNTTGLVSGDLIYITDVEGMTEVNGKYYTLTLIGGTTFSINADSTNWTTYTSAGNVYRSSLVDTSSAIPTVSAPNVISSLTYPTLNDLRVTGYNVYLNSYGVYGYLGTTSISIFNDTGLELDPSITPPEVFAFHAHSPELNPLSDSYSNFPSAVAMVQQRLCFGNFVDDPEQVAVSQSGRYSTFSKSFPGVESDGFIFKPVSKARNIIKHILDVGGMLVFTGTGEFSVSGVNGILSPSELVVKQHSGFGSSELSPILIDGNALFVQSKGSVIREIQFQENSQAYQSRDLTTFARHLFKNYEIVDWAYQSYPNEIVWAVRSDGVLLGLTYVREHEIVAWHHHDFENGIVENVCVVPENDEDAVYLCVKRTIDGSDVRYIERMQTRAVQDIKDLVIMDSAITYDGRNTNGSHTMDLSGGTTWDNTETLTLTSSTAFFASTDVGNQIHLNTVDADGNITDQIRFTIKAFSSSTVVTGKAHKTVPVALRSATAEWSRAISVVPGLDHLEGEDVSAFGDGYVAASAKNADYEVVTVTGGEATLSRCYSVIHVGLPITSDLETLDVDLADSRSLANQNKKSSSVVLWLEDTRGGFVGPKPPEDDTRNTTADPLYGLVEFKPRSMEDYDDTPDLKTGPHELKILPEWNSNGRIFIRQVDPLPMSVLGIVIDGTYPRG